MGRKKKITPRKTPQRRSSRNRMSSVMLKYPSEEAENQKDIIIYGKKKTVVEEIIKPKTLAIEIKEALLLEDDTYPQLNKHDNIQGLSAEGEEEIQANSTEDPIIQENSAEGEEEIQANSTLDITEEISREGISLVLNLFYESEGRLEPVAWLNWNMDVIKGDHANNHQGTLSTYNNHEDISLENNKINCDLGLLSDDNSCGVDDGKLQ